MIKSQYIFASFNDMEACCRYNFFSQIQDTALSKQTKIHNILTVILSSCQTGDDVTVNLLRLKSFIFYYTRIETKKQRTFILILQGLHKIFYTSHLWLKYRLTWFNFENRKNHWKYWYLYFKAYKQTKSKTFLTPKSKVVKSKCLQILTEQTSAR